jgi:hypothetical protein
MRIVAFPDRFSSPVSTGSKSLTRRVAERLNRGMSKSIDINEHQYSETDYRLPFDFNINLKPLAERDLRSLSMSCGDKAC